MGFSQQEYWSGLPFPSPGDLPDPGIEPTSPALVSRFFSTEPLGKAKWTDRWALFSKLISWSPERHTYHGPHTLTHIPHTHTTYTHTHLCTYPWHACTPVYRYPCFQAREHTYTHTPLLVCTPCPYAHIYFGARFPSLVSSSFGHRLSPRWPLIPALGGVVWMLCVESCSPMAQPHLTPAWWPQGSDFILQSLFASVCKLGLLVPALLASQGGTEHSHEIKEKSVL